MCWLGIPVSSMEARSCDTTANIHLTSRVTRFSRVGMKAKWAAAQSSQPMPPLNFKPRRSATASMRSSTAMLPKSNQLKLGRAVPATMAAMSLPTNPPAWVAGPAIPGSGLPSRVCL